MQPIPITFVIDTIDPCPGGTENQLLLLLKGLDREKFSPSLVCLRDTPSIREISEICPARILGITSFKHPHSWIRVWSFSRQLRREGAQIIQTFFRDANLAGTIAGRLAGITVVTSRRNTGYWHTKSEIMLLRLLNPLATVIVANCRRVADHTRRVEKVGKEKIRVLYNGIDLSHFPGNAMPLREEVRKKLHIPPNAPVVSCVANLRPVKGCDLVVTAAAPVCKRLPETRFLMVGDGEMRTELESRVREMGLGRNILFPGSRDDIPALLAASDVGVLGSRSEGLSNSIIEYMAAGLPVACTDVGGNRELVENEVSGLLVPAGDAERLAAALLALLLDKEKAKRMGSLAREKARKMFALDTFIASHEQLYLELARSANG